MSKTTSSAAALAERTSDCFSFDRYANWAAVAKMLLAKGYTDQQAEAILRSKWTRWAADASNKRYGQATGADLERFMAQQRNLAAQVAELTRETFGDIQ